MLYKKKKYLTPSSLLHPLRNVALINDIFPKLPLHLSELNSYAEVYMKK